MYLNCFYIFFLVGLDGCIEGVDNITANVMSVVDRLIFSTRNTTIPREVQP